MVPGVQNKYLECKCRRCNAKVGERDNASGSHDFGNVMEVAWCVVCGARCVVRGAWCVVRWCLVLGPW